MRIQDRYAAAVHSSNLKSTPSTVHSATDILGAYGIADRRLSAGVDAQGNETFSKHPLAVPLERLFTGDNGAAVTIVAILSGIICGKAKALRVDLTRVQASDMAKVVLEWFRRGACKSCNGHGFKIIPNTTTLGNTRCQGCGGSGKVPVEKAFRLEQRELVSWVVALMERESGAAGPAAMAALGATLDL